MSEGLIRLQVRNFRSLADVTIETNSLNVLFGPNGAGKSTFLNAIGFIRDCAIRGVDLASSDRSHGIGMLWDGADEGDNVSVRIDTEGAEYEVLFGYSSGRIEPFAGEKLRLQEAGDICLIDRKIGSDKADFYHTQMKQSRSVSLREPEKLAFTKYQDFEERPSEAASDLDNLLRSLHFYHSRVFSFDKLRKIGSETSFHTRLQYQCQNLWSVLRNLHDRRAADKRFETIVDFMRKCFENSFTDLFFEQTGPNTVYGSFLMRERRHPIPASGISDGHLQMLILLTALFSEEKKHKRLILFDEPELSLHPYAISVFAQAVKLVAKEWNRQVFIATHSPVLMSQFELENVLAVELGNTGETRMKRVSEMDKIRDLLEEYAVGSLYMAEMIAAQSGGES